MIAARGFYKLSAFAGLVFGIAGGFELLDKSTFAADVSAYAVFKGHLFQQTSANAPTPMPSPYIFEATTDGDLTAISGVQIWGPSSPAFGGTFIDDLSKADPFRAFIFPQEFDTLEKLTNSYSPGTYSFHITVRGQNLSPLNLDFGSPGFPVALPRISNFAACQAIKTTADFLLSWDPFFDATGTDHVEMRITDQSTDHVWTSKTIISATTGGSSIPLPAHVLAANQSYTLSLRYVKETQKDTRSLSGAVGTAGFFNETQLTITTIGPPNWLAPAFNADGSIDFVLHGTPGASYAIQSCESTGVWQTLSVEVASLGRITKHVTPAPGAQFFRALLQ